MEVTIKHPSSGRAIDESSCTTGCCAYFLANMENCYIEEAALTMAAFASSITSLSQFALDNQRPVDISLGDLLPGHPVQRQQDNTVPGNWSPCHPLRFDSCVSITGRVASSTGLVFLPARTEPGVALHQDKPPSSLETETGATTPYILTTPRGRILRTTYHSKTLSTTEYNARSSERSAPCPPPPFSTQVLVISYP